MAMLAISGIGILPSSLENGGITVVGFLSGFL
jgi:hypothetical protein